MSRSLLITALAVLAGLPAVARASTPLSLYVVPSQVELLPDPATATRVVIRGAFTRNDGKGGYSKPECGYLHFECRGDGKTQTMCRMQWAEIAAAIARPDCIGFGMNNVMSSAKTYPLGTPLGTPDAWDLGMGTYIPGSPSFANCDQAKAIKCPAAPAPGDMAAPAVADMAVGGKPASGCTIGRRDGASLTAALLALLGGALCLHRARRRA